MARKKDETKTANRGNPNVIGLHAEVLEQPITQTLETNYMPYAMSVIVSRAIPEIDGLKPSHRKLLYTMYKMNLLNGPRTKSANVVGQTMRLNPHGDATIYETMVRLSRGYQALLAPFVDSKGNFGKVYSRDMSYAASRYTEVKLDAICAEFFRDIDRDTVDFADNYDNTTKEPTLLPATFPSILVAANQGIAVGMASNICGFNLGEVCRTAVAYIQDEHCDLLETLIAPDFPTGAELIYNRQEIEEIYRTGRGSFKLRSRWRYVKEENVIEVYEIPYTTTVEAIIDKIVELMKNGKVREISDMRDETDLGGLKLAIDLKRGADPEKLMQRLFKMTSLQDSFSCNFNILIQGNPRVMGVKEILDEWHSWRAECVRRGVYYDLQKAKDRLHLLKGLGKILLDIDRAIRIIRETEQESEVVPNLMIGFGIDEVQAEFIAEIRLRNINKEYILKKISETDELEKQVAGLEATLKSRTKINSIIVSQLSDVLKKYDVPRKTGIIYGDEIEEFAGQDDTPDYPVHIFLSKEGYFKKITPLSLRMSKEQKYKQGDEPSQALDATNAAEILFFTDKCQVYKARLGDFEDTKASVLGDYLPSKLKMDEGENVIHMSIPGDYKGSMLFCFQNGKVGKVELSAYDTKSNRRRLTGAFSDKCPIAQIITLREDMEVALFSSGGKALAFNTALLQPKSTRSTQGVSVMTQKKNCVVERAQPLTEADLLNESRYRVRKIPAGGAVLKPEDVGVVQETLFTEEEA